MQRTETLIPPTADELAAILADASASGTPVLPWGAGLHQHLGHPALPNALKLQTTALNKVLDYTPADLTITVEAGASLAAIQAILRPHGQWLPWAPPGDEQATIGGLLAGGQSGPLRLGYGTPRDWLIGMRVALGDGRLVKSGGKVVKNVAGYDTHKLHIGALGTLGVIVETTFKLAPLPEREHTLAFVCSSLKGATTLAERLRVAPLAPMSVAVLEANAAQRLNAVPQGHALVLVRYAGSPAGVQRQLKVAETAATALNAQQSVLAPAEAWQHVADIATPGGWWASQEQAEIIIRAGVRPSELPRLVGALVQHAPYEQAAVIGLSGVGIAYARWPQPAQAAASELTQALVRLRADLLEIGGYAVVEDTPDPLRPQLDIWGPDPATLALMRTLKAQWDPQAILNRGRYIV